MDLRKKTVYWLKHVQTNPRWVLFLMSHKKRKLNMKWIQIDCNPKRFGWIRSDNLEFKNICIRPWVWLILFNSLMQAREHMRPSTYLIRINDYKYVTSIVQTTYVYITCYLPSSNTYLYPPNVYLAINIFIFVYFFTLPFSIQIALSWAQHNFFSVKERLHGIVHRQWIPFDY